jgi:hypothetical protein
VKIGFGDMIQREVTMSFKSLMWSLCKCVSKIAETNGGNTPAAVMRITQPRPQSTTMCWPAACTSVDGPARFGSGIGLPVPNKVIFIDVA